MKIHLDQNSSSYKQEIEAYVESLSLHDCNFGNTAYEFSWNCDALWIDGVDELLGCQILTGINKLVEDRDCLAEMFNEVAQ